MNISLETLVHEHLSGRKDCLIAGYIRRLEHIIIFSTSIDFFIPASLSSLIKSYHIGWNHSPSAMILKSIFYYMLHEQKSTRQMHDSYVKLQYIPYLRLTHIIDKYFINFIQFDSKIKHPFIHHTDQPQQAMQQREIFPPLYSAQDYDIFENHMNYNNFSQQSNSTVSNEFDSIFCNSSSVKRNICRIRKELNNKLRCVKDMQLNQRICSFSIWLSLTITCAFDDGNKNRCHSEQEIYLRELRDFLQAKGIGHNFYKSLPTNGQTLTLANYFIARCDIIYAQMCLSTIVKIYNHQSVVDLLWRYHDFYTGDTFHSMAAHLLMQQIRKIFGETAMAHIADMIQIMMHFYVGLYPDLEWFYFFIDQCDIGVNPITF